MTPFTSISELLDQSGAQFRIFDMGRRMSKLTSDQFKNFEQGNIPYPAPYLHHAWIALMMWNPKQKDQNVVWFLKFPLDEQGFLVQAVRDDFLNRLLQNIYQMLQNESFSEAEDALKDNPFSFTPEQEKMAIFHAQAAEVTQQPASQYYSAARDYFTGKQDINRWNELGLQGIADLVVRMDQTTSQEIAKKVPTFPTEPLSALACALEHIKPDHLLASALYKRLSLALTEENQDGLIAALLRGLSNIHNEELKQEALKETLASQYAEKAEVLVSIATRCNETLQYPEILQQFLEKLAVSESGQAGFSRILADLMFIPVMRILILQAFRNEDRSSELTEAIGQMFGQNFNQH